MPDLSATTAACSTAGSARWDDVAAGWSRWWPVFEAAAQPVSDRLVALAGLEPGARVLDVATGLGEPAITAARQVAPEGQVIAIDYAAAMLREAVQRAAAMGVQNINFLQADAQAPDFADASFDAVLCRWGLMFVPDLDAGLRRLGQLLRPGGRLAAATWSTRENVPLIDLSSKVLAARTPLPEDPDSRLNAFRLSKDGLMEALLIRAGFGDIVRENVEITFAFAAAEDYTRFRRDMTSADRALSEHYPRDAIDAAWQAVTEAARGYADNDGQVRFVNTAVCYSGRR